MTTKLAALNKTNLSAGILGAGVGLSSIGAYQEATAENQSNAYNAQIARNNQAIMEQNAQVEEARAAQAVAAGQLEEKTFRQRADLVKGEQRAGFAASGVLVDSGSALDVAVDTAELTELDALTIRHNTALQEYDLKARARNLRQEGSQMGLQAQLLASRKKSPFIPVMTEILSGVSKFQGRV
jgi:coproporphyrinogen III oxidase-like Fe-S oxidoreductase